MLARLVHPLNVQYPIEVTPEGIVMPVSAEQVENAESPMELMLSGMEISVSERQWSNADIPIDVTFPGIVTLFSAVP